MAEPTYTRKVLRRAVAHKAKMPFYRHYPDYQVAITGGPDTIAGNDTWPTTVEFGCATLNQEDGHWKGGWAYQVDDTAAAGEERKIVAFTADSGRIIVEYAHSAIPQVGANVEILNVFSANEIHEAINEAIRIGGQKYSDIVEDDTTFCIVEDRLNYTLSNMATSPRRIIRIWMERPRNVTYGIPTTITSTTVQDTSNWVGDTKLGNSHTGFIVSVYAGTGAGQVRNFVSSESDSGTITVAAWATNPDTTSKLAFWDGDEQTLDWWPLHSLRTDFKQNPDKLRFTALEPGFYGARLRIVFAAQPGALSADTDATVVPRDYVVPKALSVLHDGLIGDNRYDRKKHADLAAYYDNLAETYAIENPRRLPPAHLPFDRSQGPSVPIDDPLGYYG